MSLWKRGNGRQPAPAPRVVVEQQIDRIDLQLCELVTSGRQRGPMVDRLLDMRNAIRPPRSVTW